MTKAFGHNFHYLLKRESSFGVSPGGNFLKVPVNGNSLGKKRGLVNDGLAGQGRDPLTTHLDVVDVSGETTIPVDMRYLGYFLTGLLGNPSTSGSSTYTHTFSSGGLTLPSYSIEVGHKNPAAFDVNLGCMINSLALNMQTGGGPASAVVGIIGQSSAPYNSSQGGTPTTQTNSRASNFQGVLKKGGSNLADINSASLVYSNNLETFREVNTTGNIAAIEPGQASLTGSLSTRFSNDTLKDIADAGTAVDLDFIYEISASLKLTITVHEAYLELAAPVVDGPGGYGLDFNFRANYNSSAGKMMTAVLINDLAGTVYTS